mmetsp:Transcript_11067/g.33346  ORF Transcript_11067/g.33346 Transcript_11067/m.33346 type:complete len:248 (+) Transcript_11067:494-1237(+)
MRLHGAPDSAGLPRDHAHAHAGGRPRAGHRPALGDLHSAPISPRPLAAPQQLHARLHHLRPAGKVHPDLEELLVRAVGGAPRPPHLLVPQSPTRGHPLHGGVVARALRTLRRSVGLLHAKGVTVHQAAPEDIRHRLEATVRVRRKPLGKQEAEDEAEGVQRPEGVAVVGDQEEWVSLGVVLKDHRADTAPEAILQLGAGLGVSSDPVQEYVHQAKPRRPDWEPRVLHQRFHRRGRGAARNRFTKPHL